MHIFFNGFIFLVLITMNSALSSASSDLHVSVKTANTAINNAQVELWQTVPNKSAVKVQEGKTDAEGHVTFKGVDVLKNGFIIWYQKLV